MIPSTIAGKVQQRLQAPGNRNVAKKCITCTAPRQRGASRSAVLCRVAADDDVKSEKEAAPAVQSKIPVQDLKQGDIYEGTVVSIASYGAFVDIGSTTDGLLHLSELSWDYVKKPDDVVKKGQKVQVKLIKVEGQRLSLSAKIGEKPAKTEGSQGRSGEMRSPRRQRGKMEVKHGLKQGDEVVGEVARIAGFGAFLKLDSGFEVLLRTADMKNEGLPDPNPRDLVKEGEKLTCTVLKVDGDKVSVTNMTSEDQERNKTLGAGVSSGGGQLGGSLAISLGALDLDSLPSSKGTSGEQSAASTTAAASVPEQQQESGAAPAATEAALPVVDDAADAEAEEAPAAAEEMEAAHDAGDAASAEPPMDAEDAAVELDATASTTADSAVADVNAADPEADAAAAEVSSSSAPPDMTQPVAAEPSSDEGAGEVAAAEAAEAGSQGAVEAPESAAADAPAESPVPAASVASAEAAPAVSAKVDAKMVKELRDDTGAGMMDCKKALKETDGDLEAAKTWLRNKGMASAGKKAGRVAAEGLIAEYIHAGARLGVMVEVNCETDFVARGDRFREFATDVAMQLAANADVKVVKPEDVPADVIAREREIEEGKEDLQSKPEGVRGKIVEGRIAKFCNEQALMTQPFIKSESGETMDEVLRALIAEIGENIQIRRFERYELGEGLEKRDEDFAAEVAAQTAKKEEPAAPKAEPAQEAAPEPAPEAEAPAVAVDAKLVKQLRAESGAGMMDCKKALAANNNDMQAAQDFLRKKGLASAGKKAGRVTAEGKVASYVHAGAKLGVLIEVNCETDFVAKGDMFRELVDDLSMQVAACPEVEYVSVEDIPEAERKSLLEAEMQKEDLLSKPEAIREKIATGRVQKTLSTLCLLEQDFIKDTSKDVGLVIKETVAACGENVKVRRFRRFNLGEGIEKKVDDFAAEVAAQTGQA